MKHSTDGWAVGTPGLLALEDGRCFHGTSVGYEGLATGEAVTYTAMTGFQEIITDPSCAGLIVALTTPHIGNTGVNSEDNESDIKPTIRGLLMREMSFRVSNWRANESLPEFLQRHQIVALSEIDTRSLTQHIRQHGPKRAVIASGDWSIDELIQKAKNAPRIEETDFVKNISVSQPIEWSEASQSDGTKKLVVFDFGVKRSVLRSLASQGAKIVIVPTDTSAEDVLNMQPDSVVLSNGPGDAARLGAVAAEIATLFGRVPIYGIDLGHQLLGIALGAKTYRLPFGHRGTQPVLDKRTGKVGMTAQNHGFCLVPESLSSEVEVTHVNLNDGTVEGFRHKKLPIQATQSVSDICLQ